MEHIVSNLQIPLMGYITYLLYVGGYGWFDLTTYLSFATFVWFLSTYVGTDAIRTLQPDYPYLDSQLIASVRYLFGINDHLTEYPFMDVEWPSEDTQDDIEEEEREVFTNFLANL